MDRSSKTEAEHSAVAIRQKAGRDRPSHRAMTIARPFEHAWVQMSAVGSSAVIYEMRRKVGYGPILSNNHVLLAAQMLSAHGRDEIGS